MIHIINVNMQRLPIPWLSLSVILVSLFPFNEQRGGGRTDAFMISTTSLRSGRRRDGMILKRQAISPSIVDEIPDAQDISPSKPTVPISSLEALDFRSGRVVKADFVPDPAHDNKPSRLYLNLLVEVGLEKRAIISAIRPMVDPEDIIGKAVLMAINTEPEEVLGLPSQGRILYISHYSKTPMPRSLRDVLLTPAGLPPGSAVKAA